MDAATERDLFDFIDGLNDVKDKNVDTKVSEKEEKEEEEGDVWQDIANALEDWTERILYTESRHATSESFRERIEASLRRQQLDGFLTVQDLAELQYIADLWVNLLTATSCFTVGCVFVKRDIITYLLELYSLRQISSNLFIETCLKL